jgi:hypothetical protein
MICGHGGSAADSQHVAAETAALLRALATAFVRAHDAVPGALGESPPACDSVPIND